MLIESLDNPTLYSPAMRAGIYEYLLAIFRLRAKGDSSICEFLSLNNSKVRELHNCLNKFIEKPSIYKINELETRLNITVERSDEYSQYDFVPDFIYALLECITGTQEDNSIVIKAVNDN